MNRHVIRKGKTRRERFGQRRRDDAQAEAAAAWEPRTELGRKVKAHEVTSIDEIFNNGKHIAETGVIDTLLPNLQDEVVEIVSVQRMTKNNRKMKFRATVIVGDGAGHVGIGAAKDIESRAAVNAAIVAAKYNIIPVILGCGSMQCRCGTRHSLPITARGKCGSVEVILKPAPRGLGIVANKPVRRMLQLAGVSDAWSFSKGRTRVKYNSLMAVYRALQGVNSMKNAQSFAVGSAGAEAPQQVAVQPAT